jgi:cytochrome c-type protein NapB
LFCLIGASFIGFMVGVRTPHLETTTRETVVNDSEQVRRDLDGIVPSPWYRDIRRGNLSPNAGYHSDLADLPDHAVPAGELRSNSALDRLAAIEQRASRRAYFGAPPVVPHPVDPASNTSCLSCHRDGLLIGDLVAPAIPHEPFASCTQCHVEQHDLRPDEGWWLNNSFSGQAEPAHGTRAYLGAPPTIPHDISLRSQCVSCHGPYGRDGLRSTHPERRNCVQCHALDASLAKRKER